jgi:hypothetical protein
MNKQMLTTILTIALCVSLSAKEKTVRVKVKSSSQASGYPAEMSMDGDTKTIWHSVWTAGATPHPHTLSFDLGAS